MAGSAMTNYPRLALGANLHGPLTEYVTQAQGRDAASAANGDKPERWLATHVGTLTSCLVYDAAVGYQGRITEQVWRIEATRRSLAAHLDGANR